MFAYLSVAGALLLSSGSTSEQVVQCGIPASDWVGAAIADLPDSIAADLRMRASGLGDDTTGTGSDMGSSSRREYLFAFRREGKLYASYRITGRGVSIHTVGYDLSKKQILPSPFAHSVALTSDVCAGVNRNLAEPKPSDQW